MFLGFCIFLAMSKPVMAMITLHVKCRGGIYPRSNIQRFNVPDDKVLWEVPFENYDPPDHTSPGLKGKPWADLEIDDPNFRPKWNSVDGNISRTSYLGDYQIKDSVPLNPIGRTGIKGRGVLGRWGPNHAADPIVTRWKRSEYGELIINSISNRPLLQFVGIKRGDTGEWALPGGMVDPGEKGTAAAVREFQEEATNSLHMADELRQAWKMKFENFISRGKVVYKGYVDDQRNTDNAWMETIAYNFHDDKGDMVAILDLKAGDDAVDVRWIDINEDLKLYASHKTIVETVADRLNAHF